MIVSTFLRLGKHSRIWTLLWLGLLAMLVFPPSQATADYSPGPSSYYTYTSGVAVVGPNGTWMLASSSLNSSYMALSDASGHFSARTIISRNGW
jgi:hypothetical protein